MFGSQLLDNHGNICLGGRAFFSEKLESVDSVVCAKRLNGVSFMNFDFDELKATHAAKFFVREAGGTITYIRLLKLMYLADRQKLQLNGTPITGDEMWSLNKGPILSRVCDLVRKPESTPSEVWASHIQRDPGENIKTVSLTELGRLEDELGDHSSLSNAEIEILKAVLEAHRHRSDDELIDFTHELPEWTQPSGTVKRVPIKPETILENSAKTAAEIQEIASRAAAQRRIKGSLPAVPSAVLQ